MNRRQFIGSVGVLGASAVGLGAYKYWPGDLFKTGINNPCLAGMPPYIIEHPLYKEIWHGIDAAQVWDSHVHLVGTGDSEEKDAPWFSPEMDSYSHPILKIQKYFYMNGGCVEDNNIDHSYMKHMLQLVAGMKPGFKVMLMAFEWLHDENGQPQKERSIFHIPNSYAARIAKANPDACEWIASIHPYRPDCADALQQAREQGARAIKWLPQAMNIDPASARCDRFYQSAADLKLPIISHTGRESAVQGGNQDYANPLKLKRALDAGVKVILAHCASDGDDIDLDIGENGPRIKSFELFTRMMELSQYEGLLYGEISALTLRNHEWTLQPILSRTDWHHRLVNGSDYPLPGIMPLTDAASLASKGLLSDTAVSLLQEIKQYNALLYDFALKRLLRTNGIAFPASVFETRRLFESS